MSYLLCRVLKKMRLGDAQRDMPNGTDPSCRLRLPATLIPSSLRRLGGEPSSKVTVLPHPGTFLAVRRCAFRNGGEAGTTLKTEAAVFVCALTALTLGSTGAARSEPILPPASAAPADDGQWTMPAKNYANTRYSELDEINV